MSELTTEPKPKTAARKTIRVPNEIVYLKASTVPIVWARTDEDDRYFTDAKLALFGLKNVNNVYRYAEDATLREYFKKAGKDREVIEATGKHYGAVLRWFLKPAPDDYAGDETCPEPLRDDSFAPENSVLFLFDLPAYLEHAQGSQHAASGLGMIRILKDGVEALTRQGKTIVVACHHLTVPEEFEHDVVLTEHERPNDRLLSALVHQHLTTFQEEVRVRQEIEDPATKKKEVQVSVERSGEKPEMEADAVRGVVDLIRGMTYREADNVLVRAVTENRSRRARGEAIPMEFDRATIMAERVKSIRKNPALDIIKPPGGLDQLGAMEEFKAWVRENREHFDNKHAGEGIPAPKGFVLFGSGGLGKTYGVGCLGQELNRVVLRLDIGACKGSLHGQSEERFARCLRDAKALAPCILFIDEAGKQLPNPDRSYNGDNGVSLGFIAKLLTFMQENDGGVLVAMACNEDIRNFTPPMLRSGRINRVFYIPFPEAAERAQVARLHFTKRGWDDEETLALVNDPAFLSATQGYTPAEIEQVILRTLILKLAELGPRPAKPAIEHLLAATRGLVPMSRTHGEEVRALEDWAVANGYHQRKNPASPAKAATPAREPGRRSSVDMATLAELADSDE